MRPSDGNSAARRDDTSRKKSTSAERDVYRKPLLRLKQQEEILERGLITAMENMKINPNLLQGILREHRELSSKRQIFLDTMRKKLKDINSDLDCVKNIAENPEEIQKLDVNSYKQKLLKLSQKMQDFEKSCPLEILMEEGAILKSGLRDLGPTLRKYEEAQKNAILSSQCWQNKIENKKVNVEYKDVDDFHALVAATGHTDHWTMEDHTFFLKMREKCENIPALVAAIQKKYPDLSTETIVNHEAWYKHYQNLREKQKAAVKKWREQKELERNQNVHEIDDEIENYQRKTDTLNKVNEEKNPNTLNTRKTSGPEMKSTSSSASSDNSEKKELIKKWKMEKENKRTMDEEQVKLQTRLKKQMEENRRRRRREKIQEALGEYKQRRTLENALREQDGQLKEKCKYDTTLIKAFRKQDEEFTKKRMDLILRSKKPSKNDLLELKKVELVENRDHSTLMDPTTVWREKCKVEYSMRHSNDSQYVKDIPRICIRWRNEESEDLMI